MAAPRDAPRPGYSQQPHLLKFRLNDIKHIQEAVGAGANEYIMKPFDTDIIQAKFQQVGLL